MCAMHHVTCVDFGQQVNFQEFVETVVYTTNSRGEITFYANSLVRLVAATFVKKNDTEVQAPALLLSLFETRLQSP